MNHMWVLLELVQLADVETYPFAFECCACGMPISERALVGGAVWSYCSEGCAMVSHEIAARGTQPCAHHSFSHQQHQAMEYHLQFGAGFRAAMGRLPQ